MPGDRFGGDAMTMFDNVRNALRATGNMLAQALGLNGRLTETSSREHLTNPDDAVVTISRVAGSPGRRVAGSPGRRVAGSPNLRPQVDGECVRRMVALAPHLARSLPA